MTESMVNAEEKTYCAVHPQVETGLRCNKCGRYICIKCAVRTPVGFKCRNCLNAVQAGYFNATPRDYIIAGVVTFLLTLPAVYISERAGLFLVIIAGLPVAGLITEAVSRVTAKRRGRYTYVVVAGCMIAAALVVTLPGVVQVWELQQYIGQLSAAGGEVPTRFDFSTIVVQRLLAPAIFTTMAVITTVARFRYRK
jgi:hypothetical protein